MRKKLFEIVGESFDNDDGTSRQAELGRCEPGDAATLVREPRNKYDENAVAILSSRGVTVGYLSRADAARVAPLLDEGAELQAQVHQLKGGVGGYSSYGCVISIVPTGKALPSPRPLEDQQIEYRARRLRQRGCLGLLLAPLGVGLLLELAKMHLV